MAKVIEICQAGMIDVGSRYEAGEYFIGDLIYAGEIMTGALEMIKPLLGGAGTGDKGKIILCTVQGDIHDIGKNIVRSMLESAGFDVMDLGIDVPPQRVIEAVKSYGISIVALSGVLTLALNSMKGVVDGITEAGLRDSVKILVGGSPVTEEAGRMIGADEWANSPQKGVTTCLAWAAERARLRWD